MNKQSATRCTHVVNPPRRLSMAIAMALFAAGQLHALAAQPPTQTDDQTAQPAKKEPSDKPSQTADKKASAKASDEQATVLTGMTVTGYSSSLNRAQEIKRYSDTVVDAISAQDASSLPDLSVTEALQRVPGVAVSAFGIAADPDHFSIQGSDISLQGLPYVSTLFNGREVFSAGGGQGLNFSTVSPELIGSVVVNKNQTADMIEGGIAGSIDLKTRKPFDSNKETQAAFTIGGYWGSLDKKSSPQVAGLFSHIFDTDVGRFGFLANVAYDRIDQADNAISLVDFQRRCNGCTLPGDRTDSFPGLAEGQYLYVPVGADLRTQDETSTRIGHALALQWESPDKTWQATLAWNRASDTETTFEHTLQASTDGCSGQSIAGCAVPLAGTTPVYDANGVFQSGIISGDPSASTFLPLTYGGVPTQLDTAGFRNRYVTNDYSFNLKWNVNDRLRFDFDAQDTHSNFKNAYYYIRQMTQANWYLAVHGNDVPTVQVLSPNPAETTAQYFADPANTYWSAAQDHQGRSWGSQRAFRLDGTFDVNHGVLDSIQFGFRRSDQSETLQNSPYNYFWDISTPYAGGAGLAVTAADTPGNVALYHVNMPAFSNGDFGVFAPFFNLNPITQFWQAVGVMKKINQQSLAINPGWDWWSPYYTNFDRNLYVAGTVFVPGTHYLPQEISSNEEKTNATYLRLNFGNENTNFLSDLKISGNIGLRYVHTQDDASGYLIVPNMTQTLGNASVEQYCLGQTKNGTQPASPGTFCALTSAQQQQYIKFANGGYSSITAGSGYGNWLPSFNLAIGWTSDFITRFAYSRSLYRPSLVQLQAGQSVGGLVPYGTNGSTEPMVSNGYNGSNPYLRPVTAHNFDLTQEWYFGNAGSLTGMLFYKQLNNTIQYITNVVETEVTNNGVTYPEQYTAGLANLNQKGSVRGAELAYQQKFDFLLGWLSGFGTQINYTWIKSHGLAFGSTDYCPATYMAATQCTNQLKLPPNELSRDTFNFTVYYEKGPLSARLAWNWRSKFLITNQEADYPFLPVMAAPQGRLDGSLIYSINDNFKVALQAANLLNSTFKTREIIDTNGLTVPKGFFRDDTRYNLSLRMNF
ncbi:MAG: TonB-dependent receptor [Rudaea sp.]|uniref:TonB-dependent receptor n=1 Tax=Rudaea sp. TaxID=2136325 RepID=UPI0039E2F2CA